ncbi:methyltransferase, FxLD system [Nocardiopsis algeriensis]|uniref:methyltransferase, FxLD system n=1 Tax=Nocardiopsis algeriensis TaxID=1478215 RepID=UPI003B433224
MATAVSGQAGRLRQQLVDRLLQDGFITCKDVERAMRTVPREQFAPGAELKEVYAPYDAVITKTDEYGVAVSSVSAPQIQAMMLEQAQLQPGHRVLEIGSGGYNAALISEIVGDAGEVTTVDIDAEVTDRARSFLAGTGYPRVRVVCADADDGVPQYGPYDRIIVTAGAWDIPPGWVDNLAEGGRLVVPLRIRNLTRSIAFTKAAGHLAGSDPRVCGFVPMQGNGEHAETLVLVNGTEEIGLRFDDEAPVDPHLLDNAVRTARTEVWTGVTVAPQELIGTLQLYLATMLPGFCTMAVDQDLDTGLVMPNNPRFSMAAVEGGNFAYLITRRTPENDVEYGVHAFGPESEVFAATVAEHVQAWAREQRGGPGPDIDAYPVDTPDGQLPSRHVITKRYSRITFSWPEPDTAQRQDHPIQEQGE